jgi:hypothetical protein
VVSNALYFPSAPSVNIKVVGGMEHNMLLALINRFWYGRRLVANCVQYKNLSPPLLETLLTFLLR